MAANTRKLIESLGVAKPVIFGHSMGGMLAARFSASYPDSVERTVLCNPIGLVDLRWKSPWPGAEDAYKTTMAQSHDQLYKGFQKTIQRYFPNAWKPEYEKFARIMYAPTLSAGWPRLAMVRAIYRQMPYLDPVVYDWAHIQARTLVIGGDKDGENFPALAKHVADTIPHGELVLIPNVGHVPHIQAPDVFLPALLKFLA
jgi:pimeloyl-ACP methyl ester carboxylesterase